jgi:hypothetical protein
LAQRIYNQSPIARTSYDFGKIGLWGLFKIAGEVSNRFTIEKLDKEFWTPFFMRFFEKRKA